MGAEFQLKQQAKMFSQNVYLPAVYDLHRCCRVERNLVVFADAHHDGRPEAMELLYRRLKQSRVQPAYHIVEMYLDFGRASKAEVMEYSTRFMKLYARASVVVVCDNFLPVASCRKKRDTMVVQLWHACGCYKKFGYDAKDDIPEGYHGDVYRNLSLVTVSAEAAVEPFSSAMHRTHGEVQAIGVSRTDLYFSRKWRYRCIEAFRELYPDVYEETGAGSGRESDAGSGGEAGAGSGRETGARGGRKTDSLRKRRKVVLWAPTFRGNAGQPGLMDLDTEKLQRQLGKEYLVLTRVHPHMKEARKAVKNHCPIPTEQLYPVVDVLIADYSSLIYEYLLAAQIRNQQDLHGSLGVHGGLVLYVPDLDTYMAQRGTYMDIHEIPGEIVKDADRLADAVRRAAGDDGPGLCTGESKVDDGALESGNGGQTASWIGSQAKKRDAFLKRYLSACDGQSTARIAERIREHCFGEDRETSGAVDT
ncbi:CDP-glycerol glycerophosphotransferase family protein [Porcincola intestinalis]|uniref:Uncharacterized protein n=1 Tax=Porcincola intestinalis TaxID=2606632 RepID=A0A6L5X4U9_9FIRM|nr:CDP-glycerol glycerophosphotransferase family protein [Porcincola intestinalis]MSS14423.1 hypothetical protein [Porcincola intestinalis]